MFRIVHHGGFDVLHAEVLRQGSNRAVVCPECLVARVAFEEREDDAARRAAAFHHLQQLAEPHQLLEALLERVARELLPVRQNGRSRFRRALDEERLELALVLDERLLPRALRAEQRRLRDVNVAAVDEVSHLPVEKREQQRADVRAVHVRVRHDDDAVVAHLRRVELVFTDAAPERRDERPDFLVRQHLVEARLFDVQDLALDGQHGLEAPVAALLGRAAGRLALDDIQLALGGIGFLAVGELARQRGVVERALAPHEVPRLAGRFTRERRVDGLRQDAA